MEKILFHDPDDIYGCFSTFSAHPTLIRGIFWKTVEHFYQAEKFMNQDDYMAVLMAPSPLEAAKIGRDKSRVIRKDWEQTKVDIMKEACLAKVKQHASIRELLLSTGDLEIVEHTSEDSFWGDGGDGKGNNMLGKIYMEIRTNFRLSENIIGDMLPPWMKFPDVPYQSIGWRMGGPESYLMDWYSWFRGLSDGDKKIVISRYTIPDDWRNFISALNKET